MKSKLISLLLTMCLTSGIWSYGQSVPNTNTFSLRDVTAVVGGSSLTAAYANSVDAFFDPAYKGSKNSLYNFRNYTIVTDTIGQPFKGGYIAYIFQPGDVKYVAGEIHGIVVATEDQSTGISWGPQLNTNVRSMAIGDGGSNTTAIIAVYGAGSYAAKLCADLTLNGYSDWVLPSLYELNKLYLNRAKLAIGDNYYWSSSEHAPFNSWAQYFPNGANADPDKLGELYVRAIRYY